MIGCFGLDAFEEMFVWVTNRQPVTWACVLFFRESASEVKKIKGNDERMPFARSMSSLSGGKSLDEILVLDESPEDGASEGAAVKLTFI